MILVAVSIVLPLLAGALLPVFRWKRLAARMRLCLLMTVVTSLLLGMGADPARQSAALTCCASPSFWLTLSLNALDGLGKACCAVLVAFLWPLTTLYASEYMHNYRNQDSFFAFFHHELWRNAGGGA